MCSNKTEIILLTLGIIHMLMEYVLGKRAARRGGPGSVLSIIVLFFSILFSLIRSKLRRKG